MGEIQFGTGGFRAIIGEEFNKENVQKICQAISNIIDKNGNKREICVGYDNRFMSETFAIWCSEVFAGNDIKVQLCKSATSTPVVMFVSKINKNDFGVMITASHNPYQYNGVKVFTSEGKDASVDDTKAIEKEIQNISIIKTLSFNEALGEKIILNDYVDDFVSHIVKLLDMKNEGAGLKIIFDAKHGSSVEEIKLLAEKINLTDYEILNSKRDAFFGFSLPAPSPNNIAQLKEKVIKGGAQVGFALDADGDRLAVVDEKGNYIDNNYILAIVYYFLVVYCGKRGGAIKNVATSNLLSRVADKLGFKCREVPVGFKYVNQALQEDKAVVGGESSGGLAVEGHICGKDSLIAIALCLKAMSVMKKPFGEILKEVLSFVGGYDKVICDKQYSYSEDKKIKIDKMLFQDKLTPQHRYEIEKVEICDYIKVFYKNGNWVLVRFSGTEPILRIFAEADTEIETMQLIYDWEKFLSL